MNERQPPAQRPGWPLPYIPAGKENWIRFLQEATDEQVDLALAACARLLAARDGRDPGRDRQ